MLTAGDTRPHPLPLSGPEQPAPNLLWASLCDKCTMTSSQRHNKRLRKGWHPEKPGTTLKGQMVGLVKRKSDTDEEKMNHVARPLSSLRDPASFAPPPRRRSGQPVPAPSPSHGVSSHHPVALDHQGADIVDAPRPPPPFRVDTTGLSTAHLPPPQGTKDGDDGRASQTAVARTGPSLPPRLPPRTSSCSLQTPTSADDLDKVAIRSSLNQTPGNGPGTASISVPGPSMATANPTTKTQTQAGRHSTSVPTGTPASRGNELQSRFSKLGNFIGRDSASPHSFSQQSNQPPAEGTTWRQKQATLRMASVVHKDPSSVHMSDAVSAASTADNFGRRHGDKMTSCVKNANKLNKVYGITEHVEASPLPAVELKNGHIQRRVACQTNRSPAFIAGPASPPATGILGKKKPPPPPPKPTNVAGFVPRRLGNFHRRFLWPLNLDGEYVLRSGMRYRSQCRVCELLHSLRVGTIVFSWSCSHFPILFFFWACYDTTLCGPGTIGVTLDYAFSLSRYAKT
ncbi:hypothetical protein ACRALDRAFT_210051 [Sodiomyces alcalophilus JCM 7366]|uniref:uncharacterized protein n=1 Tax=Sodiomyces alcalophilus JCM 7366 TaxID=591952 RepID=UPI0039B37129